MLTLEHITQAREVLRSFIQPSGLLLAEGLCPGAEVSLKTENLQKTGSFKVRGAYYRISRLSAAEKKRGVIACSAGNHAQGVALSAKRENIRCIITMPETAPIAKVERTRAYGAEVVLCPGAYDDAYAKAVELQKEKGYTFVHPFEDLDVMAGQGTIGLEIIEQLPEVDVVLVPVGGGGLISGVATAIKALRPDCKIIGVEASNAASMRRSVEQGQVSELNTATTIADGIAVKRPGEMTYAVSAALVDEWVTVTESEIASAILTLLEDYKLLSEGAGAVAVAAALYHKTDLQGKRAVALVSGGNVDVNLIDRIINQGLYKTGRIMDIETVLEDKPRQLRGILEVISAAGANILSVAHERNAYHVELGCCDVKIRVETRGQEHRSQVLADLDAQGYVVRHW